MNKKKYVVELSESEDGMINVSIKREGKVAPGEERTTSTAIEEWQHCVVGEVIVKDFLERK